MASESPDSVGSETDRRAEPCADCRREHDNDEERKEYMTVLVYPSYAMYRVGDLDMEGATLPGVCDR